MRTLSPDQTDIRRVIELASVEPIKLTDGAGPAAVVLSLSEFKRLDAQDSIRREAKARLLKTIADIQADAASKGLTAAELDRLLADES
jgi:PHD/YefM family antitoxin component YafN of YafNO toxin-antitoxin module